MGDPPENLPIPVVFGPDFPQFTMTTRNGRQTFQSRTNQNLFLTQWDFTDKGTFTMAQLLRETSSWKECWPLLFDEVWFDEDNNELGDWGRIVEPAWDECEAFTRLLGFCGTEPEQRFLRQWCETQYARGLETAWDRWSRDRGQVSWKTDGLHHLIPGLLDVVFDFPALIPQVWLNYLGPDKTMADEMHLSENPSRVDFVVLAKGQKIVIEVDGPSGHYADYDGRSYLVNETLYAKNLAIERSLRRQGWEIHRFANIEVMNAEGRSFVDLIKSARIPGFLYLGDMFLSYPVDPPEVRDQDVADVLDMFIVGAYA